MHARVCVLGVICSVLVCISRVRVRVILEKVLSLCYACVYLGVNSLLTTRLLETRPGQQPKCLLIYLMTPPILLSVSQALLPRGASFS